jgi:DnaJ-class molecular chaperone
MTLACHHAPIQSMETVAPSEFRCVRCGVTIGPARCQRCNGRGRLFFHDRWSEECLACDGAGGVWSELKTIVPTPANREAAP